MLNSIEHLARLEKAELHNIERPIAYLAFQNAEINRDRKKKRQPFKPDDFYFYSDPELMNLPEPRYGAAAMELINRELFPNWALFAYPELKKRANDALAPELLCYQCHDAIILAPDTDGGHVFGMLIASKTASESTRTLESPCGRLITVRMPLISGAFEAIEDIELSIVSQRG